MLEINIKLSTDFDYLKLDAIFVLLAPQGFDFVFSPRCT